MPERTSYQPGTPCWIDLGTPDIEASQAFYGGLFGWQGHTSPDPATGGYTMMTLGAGGTGPVAALMPHVVTGQPVAWVTYVSVEDLDEVVKAVGPAGGQVLMEPMDILDQGRMTIFADALGAVLGAWQPGEFPGAGVMNEPGTYCWSELACRDTAAAEAFYGTVFGWRAHARGGPGTGYSRWSVQDGPPIGGMIQLDGRWPGDVAPHWMVYFAVQDCDGVAASALELGGTVPVLPADAPFGRFAVLRDPQGGHFAVVRPSAETD
ncbi:VOC family protein [Actinomadura sp. 9N407]|uniref:VOC family protein n=1 Tax=Actinomadura sp. 9N407 TaxID=3375154 RepID=UPI0037AE81A0